MIEKESVQASVAASPWKKPKPVISLSRTKSLKRKSELFTSTASQENSANVFQKPDLIEDEPEPSSKSRKTFNKFSVRSDTFNPQLTFNSNNAFGEVSYLKI